MASVEKQTVNNGYTQTITAELNSLAFIYQAYFERKMNCDEDSSALCTAKFAALGIKKMK